MFRCRGPSFFKSSGATTWSARTGRLFACVEYTLGGLGVLRGVSGVVWMCFRCCLDVFQVLFGCVAGVV